MRRHLAYPNINFVIHEFIGKINGMEILELPRVCFRVIDGYARIRVHGEKTVRCPYYRNPANGRNRWGLIVFSGKGSPEEIEEEMKIIEKLEGKDFSTLPENEIIRIMRKRGLGVDCSGFIARVLNPFFEEKLKRPIWKSLRVTQRPFIKKFFYFLRPFTHINIRLLADKKNAVPVKDINELRPGDLMIFINEIDHGAIVTRVEKEEGSVAAFNYAHSALENGNGFVKTGRVEMRHPGKHILEQEWHEEPDTGRIIIEGRKEPKFYRLRALA